MICFQISQQQVNETQLFRNCTYAVSPSRTEIVIVRIPNLDTENVNFQMPCHRPYLLISEMNVSGNTDLEIFITEAIYI